MTDPWEPLYSKRTETAVIIGLRLARPHTNGRGLIHGGLIAALADNAMGHSCGHQMGGVSSLVTIGLAVDFIGTAQIGQWLAVESRGDQDRRHALFRAKPGQSRRRRDRPRQRELFAWCKAKVQERQFKGECQSLISITRSMKLRTLADSSRDVG